MNKRGAGAGTVLKWALLVIAFIIILNFVKTKSLYASGIFSNIFGKVNESIGGVSWDDLTKQQKDSLTDQQKAESMFLEIEKSLNLGMEKRNYENFDGARVAFENALALVNQVLKLKGINPKQIEKAKGLKDTLTYYLKDLEAYKGVTELLKKARGLEGDDALNILKKCEDDYPRNIRSIDCLVRGYLFKPDVTVGKTSAQIIENLDAWLKQMINAAGNDKDKIVRLNLAAGEILFELIEQTQYSSVFDKKNKDLAKKALDYYERVIKDLQSNNLNDYVGRAYLRKAQIYGKFSKILELGDVEAYANAKKEYNELFKRLSGREFVDKQEALNGQNLNSQCFKVVAHEDSRGTLGISAIGRQSPVEIYLRVVSLDATRCPIFGQWSYRAFLKKGETSKNILDAPTNELQTSNPGIILSNTNFNIRGVSLQGYDRLVFVAYKADNEKERASLEIPISR